MSLELDRNAWTFYFTSGDTDLRPKNVEVRGKNNDTTPKNAWKFDDNSKKYLNF